MFLGAILLALGKFHLDTWSREEEKLSALPESIALRNTAPASTLPAPPLPSSSVPNPEPKTGASPVPTVAAAGPGALRVSNQTPHPVRIALLSRLPARAGSQQARYSTPAHWDFAPSEGSLRGLTLSLPGSALRLKKGDIIVAFAQDGSRAYWGPFVVGETPLPLWNGRLSEWQLTLRGDQ